MRTYYDPTNDRLVFEGQPATKDFWDHQWQTKKFREIVLAGFSDRFVVPLTKKFLLPEQATRILEGGCGRGQRVYALAKSGYDAYGIDYAKKTVELINKHFPELKVTVGDVRKIPFPDQYFDGYWSIGVIEHFFDGYGDILSEMKRVIKKGGYLFLIFPYISPLRQLKIRLGRYPLLPQTFQEQHLYQFAFNDRQVAEKVASSGFKLRYRLPYEGFKGLKDEVALLRPMLQKIYDRPTGINRIITYALSKLFAPLASHTILLVFEKTAR